MLIGVFFTPMSQSQDCKARKNKEAGVKNTPASVRFVCFSLWATAPGDHGEAIVILTDSDGQGEGYMTKSFLPLLSVA
jgi:hypothetical protein